jgi:hypothetical protein
LADLVVTQLMSSKVDEELESFFGLVGEQLYKGVDPDDDGPTFYVHDRMEITACCNMQDVPDVMARSYWYIHEHIQNMDSEVIHVSLVEYKLMLDIGTIGLMHRYHRYTPSVFPRTAHGDGMVFRPDATMELDMAGPSMAPTDELGDFGPILCLQWKPPPTYGRVSGTAHGRASGTAPGYRDRKYGKKKGSVQHQQKPRIAPRQNPKPPPKPWFGDNYALVGADFGLTLGDFAGKMNSLWLADSGASCLMTYDMTGLFDCRHINPPIKIGNGQMMMATHIGKKRMRIISKGGVHTEVVLHNVKYVPKLWVNLFSLTQALKHQWQLSNTGLNFVLSKWNCKIIFDKIIKISNGHVNGIEMVPVFGLANIAWNQPIKMEINKFHQSMGHVHKDALRKMGKYYGIKLYGTLEPCYSCSLAKIRQKNVRKVAVDRSMIPGEHLMVDISSVNVPSFGGAKFWVLVMDDCTGMCWSFFVVAKSKMPDQVILLIKKLRSEQRFKIKHIVKTV